MYDLIIDTSTATCSIALFKDDTLTQYYHEFIGRGHAEILIPEIKKILGDIVPDQIYVNIGPGSFTGIRIGISAARALSLAWNIPCLGYSTMQLVASMAKQKIGVANGMDDERTSIDVIMNGGHGEFYVQSFDHAITPLGQIKSLSPHDYDGTAPYQTGDKAAALAPEKQSNLIEGNGPDTREFMPIKALANLDVSPLYVREPDAKRNN